MHIPRSQAGQAMVFSLMFMAVVVVTLMVLYNQGLLVRNRVQIENASDAAVYSVAKLGARQMNMSAYLNRAMVANDILVGQMSGLVSSLRRYEYTDTFVRTFPFYQIPLGPIPLTMRDILTPVTAPVSRVFGAIGKPVVRTMPIVGRATAGWNNLLGVFEHVFAVATVMTQFAAAETVVNAHATPKQKAENRDPDIPGVGYFFLAQNAAQTYFGDRIDWSAMNTLYEGYAASPFVTDAERAHIRDYIDSNGELLSNALLQLNSFKAKRRSGSNNGAGQEPDEVLQGEAHRYAALVNQNRDSFLIDRGRDDLYKGYEDGGSFGIVDFRFGVGAGIVTDGGSSYRFTEAGETEKYSWSSLDAISGKLNLFAEVKFNFALFSTPWIPLNPLIGLPYLKDFPLPLGGATHQFVEDLGDRMTVWAPSDDNEWNTGDYGSALDSFYTPTLLWMNTLGLFGTLPGVAQDKAGGLPTFWSVNPALRGQNRAPPYALAVMQDIRDVHTTDRFPTGSIGKADSELPPWLDVSMETRSVGDNKSVGPVDVGDLLGGGSPMVSVSSAELYHKRRDTDESANLFSPFWDVRLVENSPLTVLIMRGMQNPANLIDGLPFTPGQSAEVIAGLAIDFAKQRGKEELTRVSGALVDQHLPPPFNDVGKNLIDKAIPAD